MATITVLRPEPERETPEPITLLADLGRCQHTMRGRTRPTRYGPRSSWSTRCPAPATVTIGGRVYCRAHARARGA